MKPAGNKPVTKKVFVIREPKTLDALKETVAVLDKLGEAVKMAKTYLTPQQVADQLQVTVDTVYRWIRDQKLRAFSVGKMYRIDPDDFRTFMEGGQDAVQRSKGVLGDKGS